MITALLVSVALAGAPAKTLPDDSVYLLDATFVDQHGDKAKLDVFRGQPVIFAMFYASCPSVCPRLISDIKRMLADMPEAQRKQTRVVLVSLDPERDTPAVLASVIQARGLDDTRTRLLVGSARDTRRVAALLGVKYRDDGKGAIDHSSRIVVLDAVGRITEAHQ